MSRSDGQQVLFGAAWKRDGPSPFAMKLQDRLQHLYIAGQTGAGKSTLLARLAAQDATAGTGFCLLDPHGDLAKGLATDLAVKRNRVTTGAASRSAPADTAPESGKVIYWDVADPSCPFGYNPLTSVSPALRPLVASGLIDALKKQWGDAWGVRMEHLLRYAILALLDQPQADLRDILTLFIDQSFREAVTADLHDEQVRHFWHVEFKALRYKNAVDGVAPIANKLGAFLAHPLVRKATCEPAEPIRFRQIMDEGRALIVNLATGRLGADAANVLGGLILSGIANASYSRANLHMEKRKPFIVYADEFHAFSSQALVDMLPQLRKYGTGLVLAHQYLDQLEKPLLSAILGNAGSLMIFRLGASDAAVLAQQLGQIEARDLIGLANHECFARIMVDGRQTRAFTAFTDSPASPDIHMGQPSSGMSS